jgi:hypothetical protein
MTRIMASDVGETIAPVTPPTSDHPSSAASVALRISSAGTRARRDENAIWSASEQPGQVCLPQAQRQDAQILAVERQDVEALHLVVMPAR